MQLPGPSRYWHSSELAHCRTESRSKRVEHAKAGKQIVAMAQTLALAEFTIALVSG
jgi:hypothetical protein